MTPKALKNGNPRCWHCLNRLVYRKGGGFNFRLVRDPIGAEHRVHIDCLPKVLGDGVVEVKETP
jgi:hypothetical protein